MRTLMHNRPILFAVIVVLVIIPLAVALVHVVARPAPLPAPDHVHMMVARVEPPNGSPVVVFDQRYGEIVAAQIYAQLVSGRHIPANVPQSCPAIPLTPYYHYELTFSHAGTQTAAASSDVQGCQDIMVTYAGGDQEIYFWLAPNGTSFWETLHHLVDAPLPI